MVGLCPGPFSLSDENILKDSFVKSRFTDIIIDKINVVFNFDSAEDYTSFVFDSNKVSRLPPQPRLIPSSNPEEEVWICSDYVLNLLKERIDKKFYGFEEFIDKLDRIKSTYADVTNPEGPELLQKLEKSDNLDMNVKEIVTLTKQSIELYRSSKQVSFYSKPIILYYSYAKLARVLFLSTYKSKKAVGNHGLSFPDTKIVECKRTGSFARFHDCYNGNPSIYLNECIFKWEDLINGIQPNHVFGLMLNIKDRNVVHLDDKKSKFSLIEHELTREYIYLYSMSMLARYRVIEWNKHMSGSSIMWDIQRYLSATQTLFPNLIFNQFHGKQIYFYPSEPILMTVTEFKSVSVNPDWIF